MRDLPNAAASAGGAFSGPAPYPDLEKRARKLSSGGGRGHPFPGFTLRPTRAFWVFVTAVPVLGVAALNTGNNALYLLLALTLGAFVASGWVSRHTLRHLAVEVRPPADVFAGAPLRLELVVTNGSRLLPATGVTCSVVGMPGTTLAPTVPPGGESRAVLITAFAHRGRQRIPPVRLDVRLPLPFFVKSSRFDQDVDVLVFPRRVPAASPRWAGLSLAETAGGGSDRRRRGEVDQLREFRPGDDRRDIHWKQTARQQRPIVMERRERALPSRFLVLDRQLPRRDDAELRSRFEDLVSEVASAATMQLRRGEAVGLAIGGAVIPPAAGSRQARRLLEQLALVQAVGPGDDPLPASFGGSAVYRLVEGA